MYKIFKHRKLPCIPCLGKRILSCNDTTFFFTFFPFFAFAMQVFLLRLRHQTSVTKLCYLRSSTFYRAPFDVLTSIGACHFFRLPVKSGAWLRSFDEVTWVVKTDIFRWAM